MSWPASLNRKKRSPFLTRNAVPARARRSPRVEAVDRLGVPQDQLPLAARANDDRRAVAGLARRQGPPQLLAGVLVEGDGNAARTADEADEPRPVQERVTREAPLRRRDAVVL